MPRRQVRGFRHGIARRQKSASSTSEDAGFDGDVVVWIVRVGRAVGFGFRTAHRVTITSRWWSLKWRRSADQLSRREEPKGPEPKAVFNSPFKDLKKLVQQRQEAAPPARPIPAKPAAQSKVATPSSGTSIPPADEEMLFKQAFEGVRPLGNPGVARIAVEPTLDTISSVKKRKCWRNYQTWFRDREALN